MEKLLTARALAEKLMLTEETVRHLSRTGIIPHINIGRNVRFRESDVLRSLENAK